MGACVGPRGSRVRMVVSELRGEKIDIIPYNEEPARFVAKALSPARVREVLVDDEDKQATVIVPDDQLSLAIGRDGQNARLAARLTGWRVDIKSETEFASEEQDVEYEGEETFDGRCMAVLSNGRRCPNAAVGGSTYCGLPQHQALSRFDTSQVAVLTPLTDDEVSILADPEGDESQIDEIVARADAQFDESAAEEEAADDGDEELDAGSTEPVPTEDVEDSAEEMAAPDAEQPAETPAPEAEAEEAQAEADAESEAALPETEDEGDAPEAEPAEAQSDDEAAPEAEADGQPDTETEAEATVGEAEQH